MNHLAFSYFPSQTIYKSSLGATEMAWCLRTLAACSDDPGSIPNIHTAAQNYLTPVPGIQCPFWSQATGTHMVHIHTYRQNTILKKNNKPLKKKTTATKNSFG